MRYAEGVMFTLGAAVLGFTGGWLISQGEWFAVLAGVLLMFWALIAATIGGSLIYGEQQITRLRKKPVAMAKANLADDVRAERMRQR